MGIRTQDFAVRGREKSRGASAKVEGFASSGAPLKAGKNLAKRAHGRWIAEIFARKFDAIMDAVGSHHFVGVQDHQHRRSTVLQLTARFQVHVEVKAAGDGADRPCRVKLRILKLKSHIARDRALKVIPGATDGAGLDNDFAGRKTSFKLDP